MAAAGPPFLTDDADPVDYQHYEVIPFYSMDRAADGDTIQGPAMDFNYGIWPEVQLNIGLGFVHALPAVGTPAVGLGDARLAAKWRLVDESDERPEFAIYPAVNFPTGSARRGLGNSQVSYQFPLWIEKNWGEWTSYGGAGYGLNHAPGAKNNFFGGWLLQRRLSDGLYLGGEIYAQGPDTQGVAGSTALNAGGGYTLRPGMDLIFTAGHSVAGASHALGYLGLYITW
jgi:hypothetical protein